MSAEQDIITSIRAIVKPLLDVLKGQLVCCTVTGALDTANYTMQVTPVSDNGAAFTARLNASEQSGYGIVAVPTQGSTVWVLKSPFGPAYISNVDVVDKLLVKVGNKTLEWDANTGILTINGGGNKGVPVAPKLVQKLNTIENELNALKTAFNSHTHVVVSVGAPTAVPVPVVSPTPIVNTILADIENPNIKH